MKPDIMSEEYKSAISVVRMRDSDSYTIKNFVSSKELMKRAALGIYNAVNWQEKKIAIVCGSGNNAGDGYALAGILAENGIMAEVFRVSDKFSEDGLFYYNDLKQKGVCDFLFDENTSFESYDIIVDCILGTGFSGIPKQNVKDTIEKINQSGKYVVCADINSGINGDTGEAVVAVRSDLTVSIGFFKKGMFLKDAPRLIGDLINVDIGIVLVEEQK